MLRLARLACLPLFLLSAVAFAQEAAPAVAPPPKLLDGLKLQDGDSIVFLGDSITHQCLYTQYVEDYFYTRFPKLRLKLHNAGVGGARAWDALQRFDKDVADYHPKYVTILLGMNDGSYKPYDDAVFQTYRKDMGTLLDRLKEIDATAIPMTPTMFDSRADRQIPNRKRDPDAAALYNSTLAYYGTWLREVAAERGLGFVDMWSPLNNITLEQRETDPLFTMIKDAVHPGADGQAVMAAAIINDLDLPRQVSAVRILKNADGAWDVKANRAKATDLQAGDDAVSFTLTAQSLPWVLPEDAARGVELARIGQRLGGEILQIDGLAPGNYTLTIDGIDVGTYSASDLADKIELQANTKTPQYQQAAQVAALNKQRNDGPVKLLRNEWGGFQRYARTKQQAEANPGDMKLQEQLAALTKQMEGLEERVAKQNAAAKELEDQIFQINVPQPRKYAVSRAK